MKIWRLSKIKNILSLGVCFFLAGFVFAQAGNANYKLSLYTNRGTFKIVSVSESGKTENLLASSGGGANSFFALKIGNAVYKIQSVSGKSDLSNTGGSVTYNVMRRAEVSFGFYPVASKGYGPSDMLKVVATVKNTGDSRDNFALKGVFDTVLGEGSKSHFSSAVSKSINAETELSSLTQHKYISSSDGENSILFLLAGNDVTVPESVTLGVKDSVVNGTSWQPTIVRNRPFYSIVSYDDSAVSVNWKSVVLEPNESTSVVFYISVGTDGNSPATEFVARALETPNPAESKSTAVLGGANSELQTSQPEKKLKNLENIDYILALLEKVNGLELDGSNTTTDEVLSLNKELDLVLNQLRGTN